MSASNDNQPQSAAAVPVEALQDEAEFDFALTDMIAGVVRHGPGEWSGDTLQLAAVASMVREKVKPLIAAQVRAEADAAWHALTESILDQSNLFAADHEDDPDAWQLRVELLTATAGPADIAAHDARVRAEERQRVAGLIRKNAATLDSFAREGSTAGLIAYLIDNVMAAPEDMGGAVLIDPGRPDQDGRDREPDWRAIAGQAVEALRLTREYVEPTVRLPAYPGWSWFDATNRYLTATGQPTVPPEPADPRPHSRACGPREHPHGPQCAADCRTCSAEGAR